MSVTTDQLKEMVAREIGKYGDAEFQSSVIEVLWEMYEASSDLFPYSRYLYVKRHALLVTLGSAVEEYDTAEGDGVSDKRSQIFKNRLELLKTTQDMIVGSEELYGIDTAALVGLITRATPLTFPASWVDPSSIFFGGVPLLGALVNGTT
jgi:hypothetical protein